MSVKTPSETEEEFFVRQEAEKRRKAAVEKQRAMAAEEAEKLKQLHWMKCPKCGHDLSTLNFKGVEIDRCFACNGTWLDAGELEALAGKESGFLGSVVGLFKGGK